MKRLSAFAVVFLVTLVAALVPLASDLPKLGVQAQHMTEETGGGDLARQPRGRG